MSRQFPDTAARFYLSVLEKKKKQFAVGGVRLLKELRIIWINHIIGLIVCRTGNTRAKKEPTPFLSPVWEKQLRVVSFLALVHFLSPEEARRCSNYGLFPGL